MYELIKAGNHVKCLDDELKKAASTLCKQINFDHWKIIMFSEDKLYGYIYCSSEAKTDRPFSLTGPEGMFFDRSKKNSYLNVILDEKKILLKKYEKGIASIYNPISKDALVELYIPLFLIDDAENDVIGCLYLCNKHFIEDDISTLVTDKKVSSQITEIQNIFDTIYIEQVDNRVLFDLVHIFFEIVKTREPFMKEHPYNVAFLSNLMALELGFSQMQQHRLYMAAILHDIGKVYISESILNKPGPLTEIEREEIKMHPIYSYNIVRDLTRRFNRLLGIEKLVLHHHERYDGTGYPDGLKGEEIPLESRIIAIADAVDAMLSVRSYKKPKSIERVINELVINKEKQFDPHLVRVMVNILMKQQRNQKAIIAAPVTTGTIELLTQKDSCQMHGSLIKTSFGYKFKVDYSECTCERCTCPLPEVVGAAFHTEYNGQIYEYDAAIRCKGKDQIYISKLSPKPTSNYFSLMWELGGVLTFKNYPSSEVVINKIGGDYLGFCVYAKDFSDENLLKNVTAVTINFDDGNAVTVTGKVTRVLRIGHKIYCDFKYLNILESTRDKIFRYIFRRQAELKKALFKFHA